MKRTAVLAVLAVLILVSCQDDQLPTIPQGPMALISDGANGEGGNADFFFLPPMVPSPVNDPNYDPDGFNPRLLPMVRLWKLAGTSLDEEVGCDLGDAAGGIEVMDSVVVPDPTGKHYQLLLDTETLSLDAGTTYRVCAFGSSGASEALGFLDIQPVDKGAKNARTGETYIFQDGRTLPIKFRIEQGALCESGQDCTEFAVTSSDTTENYTAPSGEAALSIPPGAIGDEDTVTIVIEKQDPPYPPDPGSDPEDPPLCLPPQPGLVQTEGCYKGRTEPPLYAFLEDVRMEICVLYDPDVIPDPEALRVHKYNETEGLQELEWAEPQLIDCTGYNPYAMADGVEQTPQRFAAKAWGDVKNFLGAVFLPTPLEAMPWATRVPKGLGGLGSSFSDIGGAVSEPQVADPAQSTADVPASATAGSTVEITVQARDEYGDPMAAGGDVVEVGITLDATGFDVPVTDNNDGTYTAEFVPTSLEQHRIDIELNSVAISGSPYYLDVVAGSPTQLAFTVQPEPSQDAGVAFYPAVEVTVQDALGNTVDTYSDEVTLLLGTNPSGLATLGGTSVVAAIEGVAIFTNVWVDLADIGYTLSAASGALPSATSSAFDVLPGSPARLGIKVQPGGPATSGLPLPVQPVVALYDAFNNQVPVYGTTVTAIIESGPAGGSLSGEEAVTDVSGEATYAALAITGDPDTYTIGFNSGILTSVISDAIVIAASTPVISWSSQTLSAVNLYGVWGAANDDVYVTADFGAESGILHFDGGAWGTVYSSSSPIVGPWGITGTDATDVFSVGINGHILQYDGSWSDMVAADALEPNLFGVWAVSPDTVFAVGYGGIIRFYDGVSWATQVPGNDTNEDRLFGVWGASADSVFAVGASGRILVYGGGGWGPMTSNVASLVNLWGVWGTSSHDVFAVGTRGTIVRYNGAVWTPMTGCDPTYDYVAVWGSSSSDVYAVGDKPGGNSVICHFNGTAWTEMTNPGTSLLRGVWGTPDGNVYAVGESGILLTGTRY